MKSNETSTSSNNKKTLGLTGVTLYAMTLVSSGAFVWAILPLQLSVNWGMGSMDIWPGVLLALIVALITVVSLSELVQRFPLAGTRSTFHFAQNVFEEIGSEKTAKGLRIFKLFTSWVTHLYYWVYPGVLVAFLTILMDFLLRQFGYEPTWFGLVIMAAGFSAFIGFLALHGISGSASSSMVVNILQIIILSVFSILALVYRFGNPDQLAADTWLFHNIMDIIRPDSIPQIIIQGGIAFFLVSGFETTAALSIYSISPSKEFSRGTLIGLLVQGLLLYLLQYFMISIILNQTIAGYQEFGNGNLAGLLQGLTTQLGDRLLWGNGFAFMLLVLSVVIISIMAASLTALNNGVRVGFAMALDDQMPGFMEKLHPKYATPYVAVVGISIFSSIIGAAGAIGGLEVLLGITLAANMGAFVLFAIIDILSIIPTHWYDPGATKVIKGLIGAIINLGMVVGIVWFGLQGGATISHAVQIALGLAVFWLAVTVILALIPEKQKENSL